MAELTETRESPTRAYVIHPDLGNSRTRRSPDLALEEAIALAHALPAIEVVGAEVSKLRKPDAGMLFSKGKREEIGEHVKAAAGGEGAELVLIDTPKGWPQSGFQLVAAWLRKGHSGGWSVVRLAG